MVNTIADDKVSTISTLDELAIFIHDLLEDYTENASGWENSSLPAYLDALSSIVANIDTMYDNRGEPMPEHISWGVIGQLLLEAKSYTGEGY